MNLIAFIVYSVVIIPYTIIYFKRNSITPVTTFLLFQMIMFYGICLSRQGSNTSAIKLQYLYCVAMGCFILGVEFSRRIRFKARRKDTNYDDCGNALFEDKDTTQMQKVIIWSIITLSIVLCGWLFAKNGGNIFLQALRNFYRSDYSSLSELRKDYVDVNGIGYIYQFRVVLLPILASFVLFFEKTKTKRIITIPIYILMIVFLLGTGQRNAFVFYCFFMFVYVYMMKKDHEIILINRSQIIGLTTVAIAFLVVLTITNGRVDSDDKIGGALLSLLRRVFLIDQESAIVGFQYMDSQETVWGYDWWKMLEQLLPGKSDYIPVANISYYLVYGTYRGTNPPCLWGSAWYNFNIFGVTLFPFIMGVLYEKLHKTTMMFRRKDRLYLLIYAGLCTYLGVWTSGTPMTLFNNGVVTLLILRWLCYKAFAKSS